MVRQILVGLTDIQISMEMASFHVGVQADLNIT